MGETTAWPMKTREMHNHHLDSTRWNGFPFRDGDVVIATWAKSGTTWMQQIVAELIFAAAPPGPAHDLCPWIDFRVMPWPQTLHQVEAQTHRRFLKTHLPVDALGISPRAKYIYVGRDVRDVVWSMHNHHRAFRPEFLDYLNAIPGRVGEPLGPADPDVRAYYHRFLEEDAAPFWSFWQNVRSWWDVRDLPNVKLVHFARLKADPEREIAAIADFLGVEVAPEAWPAILEHTSFAWMKAHGRETVPMLEQVLEGGADTFINKGENGRWREVLSAEEAAKADRFAAQNLDPDCAHWLATGERADRKSAA